MKKMLNVALPKGRLGEKVYDMFEKAGFEVTPNCNEKRSCIIEAIKFGTEEGVCLFCQGIQKGAAVDSFVTPMPWDMPGYENPVIMAAGAFNQGSSIELSADGPITPPYIAYMQGGDCRSPDRCPPEARNQPLRRHPYVPSGLRSLRLQALPQGRRGIQIQNYAQRRRLPRLYR